MKVALTRQQELFLIDLGLKQLVANAAQASNGHAPSRSVRPTGKKWSAAQRAKFTQTLKRKWREKQQAAK
jgi:hypothetical protein